MVKEHEVVNVCKNNFEIVKDCNLKIIIEIDKNIYPIIKNLNKKGYETEYCCEGDIVENDYKYYRSAYISFKSDILDNKNLMRSLSSYLLNLPYPWKVDVEDLLLGKLIIRNDTITITNEKDKIKYLQNLQQYTEEIPPYRILHNKGMLENYYEELEEEEYIFSIDNSVSLNTVHKSLEKINQQIKSAEWKNTPEKFWK